MVDLAKNIIRSILTSLYHPFGFALFFSMVLMLVWNDYKTFKEVATKWIWLFKRSKDFRKMFFLVFYTVMILFQTLLNRDLWLNPLSNVIGTWGLYTFDKTKEQMVLTTEVPRIWHFSFRLLFYCCGHTVIRCLTSFPSHTSCGNPRRSCSFSVLR